MTVNYTEGITAVHVDSRFAFLVGWRAPITKPMPIACLHGFELVAAWGGALLFQIVRTLF